MEPAPSTLLQLDRMDESGCQPSGGVSPGPVGDASENHVRSVDATTPRSDPGSPDGNFPGASRGKGVVPAVDSGDSGGGVVIPFLPTVRGMPSGILCQKMWMQVT